MRQHVGFTSLGLLLCLAAMASMADAQDTSNRTLFGNPAVQRELKLSLQQRTKIAAILADMEAEIARKVKESSKEKEAEIASEVLSKQGPRLQEVLTPPQALRLWQIGVQASGPAMFNSNRVLRVLKLTPEQEDVMADLSEKMVKEVTRLATDPKLDLKTIEERADQAKRTYFISVVTILTDEQKTALRELIGKPFELDALKSGYQLPRPLTFVFGVTGRNGFVLLNTKDVQKDLKLQQSQLSDIRAKLKQLDDQLTTVRLSVLKGADKDFPDMTLEEQQRIVKTILDSTYKAYEDRGPELLALLTPEQIMRLDKQLVRVIGARALTVDTIAARVKLTDEQKAAAEKLEAKFDETTAPLRVVQTQSDFEADVFEKHLARFEAAMRSLLTSDQAKVLVEIGK